MTMPQTMSNPSEDSMPSETGESSDSEPTTSPQMSGAPVFLSLQTNASMLTAGESITFTAVLTDPDGVDDIVGGTLSDPTGMIGYGPFIAAGQPGTYSIMVSWDAMQQAEAIKFENADLMRSFRAEFFDQAANKVNKDVELTLTCAEGSACGGVCTDLMATADHCGACGKVCESGCKDGVCAPAWSECVQFNAGFENCDQICATSGQTCVQNGCEDDATTKGFYTMGDCSAQQIDSLFSEACAKTQPWTIARAVIRCCCTTG